MFGINLNPYVIIASFVAFIATMGIVYDKGRRDEASSLGVAHLREALAQQQRTSEALAERLREQHDAVTEANKRVEATEQYANALNHQVDVFKKKPHVSCPMSVAVVRRLRRIGSLPLPRGPLPGGPLHAGPDTK